MEPISRKRNVFTLEVAVNRPSKHKVKDREGKTVEPMDPNEFARLFGAGKLLAVGNIYQTIEPRAKYSVVAAADEDVAAADEDTATAEEDTDAAEEESTRGEAEGDCLVLHVGCTSYVICP
jgi:hypothetical protein